MRHYWLGNRAFLLDTKAFVCPFFPFIVLKCMIVVEFEFTMVVIGAYSCGGVFLMEVFLREFELTMVVVGT